MVKFSSYTLANDPIDGIQVIRINRCRILIHIYCLTIKYKKMPIPSSVLSPC